MGERLKDLVESAKGVIGDIVVEDVIPELGKEMLKGTAVEATTDLISFASPRIGGLVLAYKQKRWERNWEYYLKLIIDKQDDFNNRLEKLEQSQKDNILKKYFPLISDYVGDEKQQEKIDYIVNGFLNVSAGINHQEDTIIMYYDTLQELSLLDIRVLKCYASIYVGEEKRESISGIMEEYELELAQVSMIKEKLVRLGLLESKNDDDIDHNMQEMTKYFEAVKKGKKLPSLRLKRIRKSESYKLTRYGRRFILFFLEEYKKNSNDEN